MLTSPDHIVITGAAAATPLGLSVAQTWQAILAGRCGIGPMSQIEPAVPPGHEGGQVPDLPAAFAPELPREVRYLRWTIEQALRAAAFSQALPYPPERCGVLIGTTLHGMRSGGQFLRTGDHARLRDFLAGAVLQSATKGLALAGMAITTCAACSSGLAAVAMARTLLRSGRFDLVLTGGYDPISEYPYCGFQSLRLVAPGPVRPFCRGREGMKVAEAYGILILERQSDALARNAPLLATVLGCGESADSFHLTQPHPEGEGAARAIVAALRDADTSPAQIDLIAAHATGTPDNDAAEYAALARAFGPELPRVPVVAFKSHLGHTLGAAGAVELILSATALHHQVVPACAGVRADEVEFAELNLRTGSPQPATLRKTLNCSLGFGGANTCVVLKSPCLTTPVPAVRASSAADVYISGVGVILPGARGMGALAQRLRSVPAIPAWCADAGPIPEADYIDLLTARRVRRMSPYVKLTLASAMLALEDARIPLAELGDCCAILGTSHGSTGFTYDYYSQIVKEGLQGANPVLFAEGVPNAAAAQLSLMASIKGGCQTIVGTRTAAIEALALAFARIAAGQWDRALVGAAEEYDPVTNEAHRACGLYGGPGDARHRSAGFTVGSGAVMFMLESADSLKSRSARARAQVLDVQTFAGPGTDIAAAIGKAMDRLNRGEPTIGSANGTWVDRIERRAAEACGSTPAALYGHMPELYSVSALASIAAVLATGRLPPLLSDAGASPVGPDAVETFVALCTGFTDTAALARLRLVSRR